MDYTKEFGFDISGLKAFCGYYYDLASLKKSASGGMASIISEQFIKENGCVFGVKYSSDYKGAEYCCVTNFDGLDAIKGSKYIVTQKKVLIENKYISVFDILKEKLQQGQKVLFIGLGCDVAGVYSYCKTNNLCTDNLFLIDLICAGPTRSEVAKSFIEEIEKKFKSKVVDFSVKYKKYGWEPRYVRVVFQNGKIFEKPFYETDYGEAFNVYVNKACCKCNFKGVNHKSDLTIGDYWGVDEQSDNYNKWGVSVAFVNTDKGKKLLDSIDKDKFYLEETDLIRALRGNTNYCYSSRIFDEKKFATFQKNLIDKGLHYAVKHSTTLFNKIKIRIIKFLKCILPKRIISLLRIIKQKYME